MDGQLPLLLKHYGIDAKKPVADKQLLKRIEADKARYEASLTDTTTNSRTKVTQRTAMRTNTVLKTVTGQSNLSGRSHGRSTGPVKKSGANKRSGGGREHGECMGASSRTSTKQVQMRQVAWVESGTVVTHSKTNQINRILEAYSALQRLL